MREKDEKFINTQIKGALESHEYWSPRQIDCPVCKHKTIGVIAENNLRGVICCTCGAHLTSGLVKIEINKEKK